MATIAPPPAPANRAQVDSEGYIDQQIGRTRRALKLVDFSAGVITLSIGLLGFLLVAALLDHWVVPGGLNDWGRAALFGLLAAALLWYLWRQFVPLLRPINPVFAAHTIERTSPSLKNSLLNALLFRAHRDQTSARIYHALERQAAERLSAATVDATVDHSVLLRLGYALLAIIALAAVYSVLSPKNLVTSAVRVLTPWSDVAAPSRVQILEVTPGDASVALGERLTVSAEIRGLREEESVRVRYSTADEQTVDESAPMTQAQGNVRYETQLPRRSDAAATAGVQQNFTYWIEAGDARSKKFSVTVFERPTMVVQQVRYEYPTYTGMPSKEVESTGDLRGIEGTRVVISAIANEPIKSAFVDFDADGRNDVKMSVEGNGEGNKAVAIFELGLKEDRRSPLHKSYALRFTTTDGRPNADPAKYQIEVTPDYAPEVQITKPEEPEHAARFDEIVPIGVEARDPDFALQQVRLVGKVGDRDLVVAELPTAEKQEGRFGATELFTPGDAQLKPGDVLEYWAEARDNRQPEANVSFSEHRRLTILDAPKQGDPQAGNQQQQPGQPQPGGNDGEAGGAQAGGEGEPQQGGEAGESGEQSGDGDPQQGPGASGGGKGKPGEQDQAGEGQPGAGGAGESGESSDSQAQQQPGGGQGAGGKNKSEPSQPGENNAKSGGDNAAQPQQDSADPNQSNPSDGGANGGGNETQPGESSEPQQSKVSTDGDEDATAFDRIAEHMEQENAGGEPAAGKNAAGQETSGEPSDQPHDGGESAEQKAADPKNAGSQAKPGDQAAGDQSSDAPGEQGQQDAAEQQPNEADEPGQQADNAAGAAGQSQKGTGQKAATEGAQPKGPREEASAAEQQTPAAGDNPSKREGADVPRETKNGDGNPEQEKSGTSPSPDSAMNRNDGDAGAGHSSEENQGSPGDEASAKKARDKTDDDNRDAKNEQNDQEPPGGSPDKRESDSKGGPSGDATGGGQEGGGQKADAKGKGEAGQHEAADEGAGAANEQGKGETGSKAGDQQLADDKTGQSSGDQAGEGTQSGNAADKPSGKPPGENGSEPGGEQGSPNTDQPGGEDPSEKPGEQQPNGDAAGQPPSAQGENKSPPNAAPPNQQPPQEPGQPGQAGSASSQPSGSGQGAAQAGAPPTGETQPGDAVNLDYARMQTDLVLERLDSQLAKKKVDPKLLKSLGWTEAELRQFVDRWKDLKVRADDVGEDADAARAELDDALRSLGIRPGRQRFKASNKADEIRDLNDAYRTKAPAAYADRVREYLKGVASGDEK